MIRRILPLLLLLAPDLVILPLLPGMLLPARSASAQYITLKDLPETYGSYAVGGDCAQLPRVTVAAAGIRIDTAGGPANFPKPDVTLGYGGREDHSTTFFLQGVGEGLILSIEGNNLWTSGGEHLGAAERALMAVSSGDKQMRLCGAQRAEPAPPPVEQAPQMRATRARALDELARLGFMTDPGFHDAYLRALGPLQREGWLIDMDGPGDHHIVTVGGARYLQVTTCKPGDCGDNAMLVLYRPETGALFGFVSIRRWKQSVGQPPAALAPQLNRLWKAAWPAG